MMQGLGSLTLAAMAALLTGSAAAPDGEIVKAALTKRLPKTQVTSVDCSKVDGLCEVVAGSCLLYTSPSPRDVEEARMPSSA